MTDKIIAVVPSPPGYDSITLIQGGTQFDCTPILAWTVTAYSSGGCDTKPVCVDWRESSGIIRQPDGAILFPDGMKFPKGSEAGALAYAGKVAELLTGPSPMELNT